MSQCALEPAFTKQLPVHPNPVKNLLFLDTSLFKNTATVKAIIYNAMGQQVFRDKIYVGGKKATISLEKLPKGFYILRLQSGKQVYGQSFIKL